MRLVWTECWSWTFNWTDSLGFVVLQIHSLRLTGKHAQSGLTVVNVPTEPTCLLSLLSHMVATDWDLKGCYIYMETLSYENCLTWSSGGLAKTRLLSMSLKLIMTGIGILSKSMFEVKHFNCCRLKSVIVTWACVIVSRQPLEQNGFVAEGMVSWKPSFLL